MPLLLVIHIMALLFWCGALLYLPALTALQHREEISLCPPSRRGSMPRFIFTNISSPFALAAIVSGTLIFMLDQVVEFWLVVKLTLVVCLTVIHALMGLFLLRISDTPHRPVVMQCVTFGAVTAVFIVAILCVVLVKPQ